MIACTLTLKSVIDETTVDDGDQCMAFDVPSECKFPMRFLDVPFFLEFGGGFAVICGRRRCTG